MRIKFIGFKIESRNPVHGKHALSFFDVISHGTSFVVKTPKLSASYSRLVTIGLYRNPY
ncbi:hypothetical protein P4S80_04645 [Aeribacillus composti]|uniref:hypothetical protein n=1 Tax=Aeribacillus composti TaxID=1868734 RepID=UPI002E1F4B5D|nr:hypothetical protein [Aeribacillus composti]